MNAGEIELGDAYTVAFVGVVKNAGKTTALNRFVERLDRADRTAGLASIGVDGEATDAVVGVDKPPIFLPAGFQLAAGVEALERASARFEYLRGLQFETAFGPTYLVRVVDPGEVVVGGLRHGADLNAVREVFFEHADATGRRLLIDGAFGRTVAADGRLTDAVVLATGAAAAESVDGVVERTRVYVETLQLEGPNAEERELGEAALRARCPIFEGRGERSVLEGESTLRALRERRGSWPDSVERVALPGALTDPVAEELLRQGGAGRTAVLVAPASIQTSVETWRSLAESSWHLSVLYAVDLVGLAANPTDPTGPDLPRDALLAALRTEWPELAVFDATAP